MLIEMAAHTSVEGSSGKNSKRDSPAINADNKNRNLSNG
jgi:hypothetical protein